MPMRSTSSPVEHQDFWFEDGDVVLSVTEDGVEHHFRVHRLILKIASPVFRDMLSMPRPSGSEDMPVPLPEDSVQDVTALLGALYISRKAQNMTLDVALGILRLSHKYQIEGIRDEITRRLLEDWPLRHSDYITRLTFLGSSGNRIPQALKIIDAAQHCQASELLPTAFYELACAWGTRWEEIVVSLSLENLARLSVGCARSEQRLRTFARDQETPRLMWNRENVSEPITIFQYRAKDFSRCHKTPRQLADALCPSESTFPAFCTKLGEYTMDAVFPITALQRFRREDLGRDVCEVCKDWFMKVLANKIQELWESIPDDFNLPKVSPHFYSHSQIKML
ncbi:hypothetical protein JB92DRAFT_3145916 [Gautieria morchelliformis]|nr:hypothetical protein JB92DRAFT_3145916 [Gautieria morchelliformis]